MDTIKKAGILTGAVVGGVIGGALSVVGKVSKNSLVDDVGESITQSAILTGSITGGAISGAADLISGKITGKEETAAEGLRDLKGAGKQVVGNFIENTKFVLRNSIELAGALKEKDRAKAMRDAKNLAKIAAVGAITVGAIKMKESIDKPKSSE